MRPVEVWQAHLAQPPELVAASSRCCPTTSASGPRGWRPRHAGSSPAPRCGSCSPATWARTPSDVEFTAGPHGKPEILGSALRFNLSHSGDLAVIALTRDAEVGIDVERTSRRSSAIERTLTEGERASLNGGDRHTQLLQIWCRKEALAKAGGGGLGWAPETFDTSAPGEFHLSDLLLDDGYVGALAVQGARARHRARTASSSDRRTSVEQSPRGAS